MSRSKDKAEREVRFIDRQRAGHGESNSPARKSVAIGAGTVIGSVAHWRAE